jgi:hypothetical protein
LLGIIAWTAENERNATRERTMGNRRRLRANGAFVEGLPPLGYTVEGRRLVVAPEHALIVVRIYTDSANGVSVRKIVDWLRIEHPRVVVGRTKKHVMQWTTNNVLKILRNRLYTGYMETAANGRKRTTEPGSGKWIQTHEAIIPPALFEQVAQGLSARKRSGRTVENSLTHGWLLKRVAKCAECGYTVRASADRRVRGGEGATTSARSVATPRSTRIEPHARTRSPRPGVRRTRSWKRRCSRILTAWCMSCRSSGLLRARS